MSSRPDTYVTAAVRWIPGNRTIRISGTDWDDIVRKVAATVSVPADWEITPA